MDLRLPDTTPFTLFCLPLLIFLGQAKLPASESAIDFNRDIRPLLSNRCIACHGPDEEERKAGLRLDTAKGATADLGGYVAITPGDPGSSEVLWRITSTDDEDVMPPPGKGDRFTPDEAALIRRWIVEGAEYDVHWSYAPPVKVPPPAVTNPAWPVTPIDRFLLARMEDEGLSPSPEASRRTLARRVALDLTGLPPSWDEIQRFVHDERPDAYDRYVDAQLAKPAFGEHWANLWLDQARYADSSGYPSDKSREIWSYRDWVIEALNQNMPFDRFTIEQIAGDLLPEPTDAQYIATAFHRNTMTQNEGGTSDEEFRVAAVVDRVNTTMEVWMGTTMACAQCHTHKYDPITHEEYFRFYAILNQTADADRADESPVYRFFTRDQQRRRDNLQREIDDLHAIFRSPDPAIFDALPAWDAALPLRHGWNAQPNATAKPAPDGLALTTPFPPGPLEGLRLSATSTNGAATEDLDFAQTLVEFVPDETKPLTATRFRVEVISDHYHFLNLAEVEIYSGTANIARLGKAKQISTNPGKPGPEKVIDGDPDSFSTTGGGTETQWWQVTFDTARPVDRIAFRKKRGAYLDGVRLLLFDENDEVIWKTEIEKNPRDLERFSLSGRRVLPIQSVVAHPDRPEWTLIAGDRFEAERPGHLRLLLPAAGAFALETSHAPGFDRLRAIPSPVLAILSIDPDRRSPDQTASLRDFYARQIAPELLAERKRLADRNKKLAAIKPASVPIMEELPESKQRVTRIQLRGNWLDLGDEVEPGVPAAFHPLPDDRPADRLALAEWLVSRDNPLTARVTVNRFWAAIFGTGIVSSSEEFGSQGDLPFHPELLDWLAVDFMEHGWDVKRLLKQFVLSRAYRQESGTPPALNERDPENRFLARGPRFRPTGEQLRDQALAVSGLLSRKMGGPGVRPMAPNLGLKTAFGRQNDWKTSEGEDRHRRSVYTELRRNNPYASFATLDAPNREVCTVSRGRTNTPLQAFVTLNDPVFVETNQALARRILDERPDASFEDRLRHAYHLTLARDPREHEVQALRALFDETLSHFLNHPDEAEPMATDPLGPAAEDASLPELATWTTLNNVLTNLDEFLMRP